ncbi:MAG TPA: SbcC/MukB-like Walker B domain-containing protein, partial [Candidatus Thermoplasmatota archaeon]|nr:SbcC/MukB-like Walker B domain-containing protein [Candidatus Thermoplasmatota archaeon]
ASAAARKEAAAAAEAERAAERGLHAASAVVDADAARLEAVQERLARERERREAVEAAAAEAAEWTALAGAAGGGLLEAFRDHLVARVGPAVGAEASRLLALFSGGRYQEMLLDAEYEVYVTDNGVRYTLERFSGGEADLAYLALRLAVSRLLAERSGTELRFLALDEVFGSLDRERREHVAVALRGLGALYSQVLVISHLEGLEDALEHAFRMEDVGGEAAVRVAGGPASARLVDPAAAVLVQNG